MRKVVLLATSLILTPTLLIITILFFFFLTFEKNKPYVAASAYTNPVSYAALPGTQNVMQDRIDQKDGRVEIVKQFFHQYKSDLEPYAQEVIDAADRYALDYRLIPSIAMQESGLCKKAPKDSFNCWGFGIYGKKVTKFQNYSEAIETVTKTLARDYKEGRGLETPEEIMKVYTPQSKGSWADGVNHFMAQLQ
ncbi:hypothetical protein M1349_05045 [Patescibacteria group bacterium]|nr:hypothetical protein [Patescibacteria group bacterium]